MNPSEIEFFMAQALLEGRKAVEKCYPNPPVGCVLTRNGKIFARGHTNEPGEPHAEIMAINTVRCNLENVTCFVLLEPCSYVGRTPSCARELVDRGIRKVFIGAIDPHPQNRGAGIDILKNAGIRVESGILEKEVRSQLSEHFAKYC